MASHVGGVVEGPLKVLVIDSTGDVEGFEHEATWYMCHQMRAAGIDVIGPIMVDSITSLAEATQQDFSALLWVAHGSAATDGKLAEVWVGEVSYPWVQIGPLGVNLDTKLVALCICSAANGDMVVGLHMSEAFALMTVASDRVLLGEEAKAFFPAFFSRLKPNAFSTIEPQLVKEAVDEFTGRTNGKMHLKVK